MKIVLLVTGSIASVLGVEVLDPIRAADTAIEGIRTVGRKTKNSASAHAYRAAANVHAVEHPLVAVKRTQAAADLHVLGPQPRSSAARTSSRPKMPGTIGNVSATSGLAFCEEPHELGKIAYMARGDG